ncbi:MAG: tyrosine-type recombinase/integrase [Desulfomonilaceae bacterium]
MPSVGKIYKDRGDRWFIQLPGNIRIYCDKQHRTFYSRQHAEWTLHQIHNEIEQGVFDADFYAKSRKSLHSFEFYAEEWLKTCERRVELGKLSRGHFTHIRHYVRVLFLPAFGKMNITEIRGKEIKDFYLSLERSPKTTFNIMGVLHKLFRDARDEEVIQTIPKFPPDLKFSELPEPDWKWVNEEVQEQIFQHLEPNDLFFIMFQACHGTRTGETRALTHADIDLENDVVVISKAFSDNQLRYTKTKHIRRIPLDPLWKGIYLTQPRSINPRGFVFTRNSKPFSESWARKRWNEACKKAGVPHVTLYAGTRHSIASQAANRGISIYLIAKFLGHTNVKTTERYAHLNTNPLRQIHRKASVTNLFSTTTKSQKVTIGNNRSS